MGFQEGHMIALLSEAPPLKQMFYTYKHIGISDVILLCILQLIFDFKQLYVLKIDTFGQVLTKTIKICEILF